MPRKLHPDKRRISYAEWRDNYEVIEKEAKQRRVTPTIIFREAVQRYVELLKIEQEERKRGLRPTRRA